jgi:hypothetical protein
MAKPKLLSNRTTGYREIDERLAFLYEAQTILRRRGAPTEDVADDVNQLLLEGMHRDILRGVV